MHRSEPANNTTNQYLHKLKQRARVILLLEAIERVGISPMPSSRLHAFAYLADVLSPVWDLTPFDGKIYKSDGGPHYPDLQNELDYLAAMGLVQVGNLRYVRHGDGGSRIAADYALNFSSSHTTTILDALGAGPITAAIDPSDCERHTFLVELASALATLPDDQIDIAAGADVTYLTKAGLHNIVDFAEWTKNHWEANPSWQTAERFHVFLPEDSSLLPGEKLYLYAAYLGKMINAA